MNSSSSANSINLAGPWRIRADENNTGVTQQWYNAPRSGEWRETTVPGPWQRDFGLKDPPIAWYAREVVIPAEWKKGGARVWLRFDAVATDTTVWVNGREIGTHSGNWAPFHFDITEALSDGNAAAAIVVRVDKVPATPTEWIDGAPVFGGHLTRGFHDILSIQTAGIWDGVRLERSGGLRAIPNGVSVIPDVDAGTLNIDVELEKAAEAAGTIECVVTGPDGGQVASQTRPINAGAAGASLKIAITSPQRWSPESPALYTVRVRLVDGGGADEHVIRAGFRKVRTGGENNQRLLLNDRPIFLSGVLDWGHEPQHISPTPTREELRERFAYLRKLGFNCVCLCMWYPPEYFFEIADETGMMLWQEHPIWKTWMGDDVVEPLKAQFVKFFRRDANHPSVVLVSGSCEHERFNAKLAAWWWSEAKRRLPDRVHQIQTAFYDWTDPEKTDIWDEHTYESAGRWVRYLDDLQGFFSDKKPKPFIMGESVIYTSWADVKSLTDAAANLGPHDDATKLPWWYPKGFAALASFEKQVRAKIGDAAFERFRARGEHYHLQGRKFQMERYRSYPNHCGHVQNHLRDVAPCRCGYQDDLGRWRFTPEQTRPWLGEQMFILETPDQCRGFIGGQTIRCKLGISNFGTNDFSGYVFQEVEIEGHKLDRGNTITCAVGEVAWQPMDIPVPAVDEPTRATIRVRTHGSTIHNEWTLWLLPNPRRTLPGVYRLAGLDFVDADDTYPDFEEHAYSSGWGLKVRTWTCPLPNPAKLTPGAAPWRHGTPIPADAKVIVAHKLTDALVEYIDQGGRVVHLTSKTVGSAPNQFVSMWGQVPLLLADRQMGDGIDDVLIDLLDYDLTRRTVRTVPTGQLGLADTVEPFVRLVWTHDMQERPKLLDSVFAARVGKGLLVVSSLDHTEDAGRWLLDRLLAYAAQDKLPEIATLPPSEVRRWTVETMQK